MRVVNTYRIPSFAHSSWIALLVISSWSTTNAQVAVRQQSNQIAVDIIVGAHADDWQVFMGDVVVERIKSGRRPVFIYLTAGDHGRDAAYWRQREAAALQSTRIALSIGNAAAHCDSIIVRQHTPSRAANSA